MVTYKAKTMRLEGKMNKRMGKDRARPSLYELRKKYVD